MKEQLLKLEEIFVAQFMLATGDQLKSIASVRYSFASRLYYSTLLSMLKQVGCWPDLSCVIVINESQTDSEPGYIIASM